MQPTALFSDDSAVSPVIGVILMVAITVILAAIIGTFVMNIADEIGENPPNAQMTFDHDEEGEVLRISHDGGDNVPNREVVIVNGNLQAGYDSDFGGDSTWFNDGEGDDEITAGQTATLADEDTVGDDDVDLEQSVTVTWQGDGTSTSLGEWTP